MIFMVILYNRDPADIPNKAEIIRNKYESQRSALAPTPTTFGEADHRSNNLIPELKLFWISLKDIIRNQNFRLVSSSVALLIATTNAFRIQAVFIIKPSLDSLKASKLVGMIHDI